MMKTRNKRGKAVIIIGIILLLTAAGLTVYNAADDRNAAQRAAEITEQLKAQLPAYGGSIRTDGSYAEAVGGRYIGIVAVPNIGAELPVYEEWDEERLGSAACRFCGEAGGEGFVIGAKNYTSYFRRLGELETGDKVYFFSADGSVREYEVSYSELIRGGERDTEPMLRNSGAWDLTLFTRTWSGLSKVTVRCVLKDERTAAENDS